MATLEFITNTVDALDNKKSTLAIFLDLSKAFDTINHDILLYKLDFYGIRGPVYDWIKSYLSDRSQYVQYLGCKSGPMQIKCGVPQGSVIGPLLFIIYMNDLPDCLHNAKGILFADDTTLYESSYNINELYISMNHDLAILSDWFQSNKLSLNLKKTNYMLFTKASALSELNHLKVGNEIIEKKSCVKFLGIHIDEKLTWTDHIKVVRSKLASAIYSINRIKSLIPSRYKRTLYFTLAYPYLAYGIPIWGSAYSTHKRKLIIMQKKIIRIISGSKYNEHTNPLFCDMHILKVDDIYQVEVAKLAFKYNQSMLPDPLKCIFMPNNQVCKKQTRQS